MAKNFDPGVYRAILRVRQAYAFDIGGFLMRFYSYMMNIGTITMITLAGRSFLTAGLVSSAIALCTFLISPRISKLVDDRGQHRVVPVAAAITLVGWALMLATVGTGGPDALLFVAAVLMGFVPNPQALTRARWTYLIRTGRLGDAAPDLRTMFSYEGVLDDIGFMFSPSISIALASSLFPTAGLLAGGISFAVGVTILSLSRSTEPEPGWGAPERSEGRRRSVFRTSAVVRVLFLLMLFLGAFYGIFDTATVALAEELHDPNIASIILIIASFVSMIMGFVFGMIRLRVPQYLQLVGAGVLIGCAYGSMALIDSAYSLFVVSTLGALFYAPFLIVCNATCERAVPGDRLTEAITWMNAGSTCGMAFGPSLGGLIIDEWGAVASFDLGAALAIAIPVTLALFYRLLKRNVRDEAYEELAHVPAGKGE
ncbi:MAG: MFS transporter [Eggerthellaceae bacterium]|nr:MFS transporter [Eggerthellaceae bacterium]